MSRKILLVGSVCVIAGGALAAVLQTSFETHPATEVVSLATLPPTESVPIDAVSRMIPQSESLGTSEAEISEASIAPAARERASSSVGTLTPSPKIVPPAPVRNEPSIAEERAVVDQTPAVARSLPVATVPTNGTLLLTVASELSTIRTRYELSTLHPDDRLHTLAAARSRDMATRNYFSHTNPDGCGIMCHSAQIGVPVSRFAENIGWYAPYDSLSEAALAHHFLAAWMESKGHRDNLLTPELTHYGVGTAPQGEKLIITMVFATME